MTAPANFSTDTTGLAEVSPPTVVRLADGDLFELRIDPDAITTRTTLAAIRAQALAGKGSS